MHPTQRNGILLIVLLAGTIWLNSLSGMLEARSLSQVRLPELPERLGQWTSQAFDFSKDPSFATYAGSQLGGRRYTAPDGEFVDVFLVGTGRFDQFHTPEFCYQSDGRVITEERSETFVVRGKTIEAKRMRVENSRDKQDVLFWFQSGDATAPHRAWIKAAAITQLVEGRSLEPMVLYRFSCLMKDDTSSLDSFVNRMLPHIVTGRAEFID